jgi:hypothetical protein
LGVAGVGLFGLLTIEEREREEKTSYEAIKVVKIDQEIYGFELHAGRTWAYGVRSVLESLTDLDCKIIHIDNQFLLRRRLLYLHLGIPDEKKYRTEEINKPDGNRKEFIAREGFDHPS